MDNLSSYNVSNNLNCPSTNKKTQTSTKTSSQIQDSIVPEDKENFDHPDIKKKEIEQIKKIFNKNIHLLNADINSLVVITKISSDKGTRTNVHLVVGEKGIFGTKIKSIVKIDKNYLSDEYLLKSQHEDLNDKNVAGVGGMKLALKVKDIKNNDMVLAVLHSGDTQERGIAEGVKTSKKFTKEKYFAFGTFVRFNIKIGDQIVTREAYLGPEKKLGDLEKFVEDKGNLKESEKVEILLPAAKGFERMHRGGVIHQDIKPGNLFMDEKGAKVADPDTLIKAKKIRFAGSPEHMAPELLKMTIDPETLTPRLSDKGDPFKCDTFSFGTVLWYMATGERPFDLNSNTQPYQNLLKNSSNSFESHNNNNTDGADDWSNWSFQDNKKDDEMAVVKDNENVAVDQDEPEDWNDWSFVDRDVENLNVDREEEKNNSSSNTTEKIPDEISSILKLSLGQQMKKLSKMDYDEKMNFIKKYVPEENRMKYYMGLPKQDRIEVAKAIENNYNHLMKSEYGQIMDIHENFAKEYAQLKPDEENSLKYLAWQCLNPDPSHRPRFKDIVNKLEHLQET